MPPQAAAKSPVSRRFRSGVHGEWSDDHAVEQPVGQGLPTAASRLAASRIGGQHLYSVAPVGTSLGVQGQVVRAGLGGDAHALGFGGRDQRQHVAPRTGAGCAPARRCVAGRVDQRSRPRPRSASSRAGGQEVRVRPAPAARVEHVPGPRRARRTARPTRGAAPRRSPSGPSGGNSARPESARNALKPNTPASCSAGQVGGVARHRAAPEADVDVHCPRGRGPLDRSASTVTVGGMLFSGMSIIVVTPPAAAARVAVAKPSHSVRPGSLTCTWVSTRPGSSASVAEIHDSPRHRRHRVVRLDGDDPAVAHDHRGRPLTVRRDHPPRAHHQIDHAATHPLRA